MISTIHKIAKTLWQPRFFIIMLIGMALVVAGVRLDSVATSSAIAEDTPAKISDKTTAPPEDKPEKSADKSKTKVPDEDKKDQAVTAETDKKSEPEDKPAHVFAPPPDDLTAGELEVLKQLSARRGALDVREQEIQQKNALLQAAEQRVDEKIKAMEALRSKLQTMLGQTDEAQQAQIENLVKIYEVMKPKEAARILQTLDLPILLGVMRQMKPAKSAPILAEMDAGKAKDITMNLVKQHELPDSNIKSPMN